MLKHLIDTDILSFYMKGNKNVIEKFENYLTEGNFKKLTISEITYFEIKAGLEYKNAKKQIILFNDFMQTCELIRLTKNALDIAANRYGILKRKGIDIGTPDLLIAGIAIDNKFTLVTNNVRHFQNIEGLKITNWYA